MKPTGRKIIAGCALVAAGVMLWLERDEIRQGAGGAMVWVAIAALAIVLAVCELAGVGENRAEK